MDLLMAASLDEADLTEPVIRTKQGVKVKPVNKLAIGVKRNFYNAFSGAGELAYTLLDFNPDQNFEKMGLAIMSKRMKTYIPRDCDLPTYEKEEFERQTELEIMKITLNFETYNPQAGKFLTSRLYRTVTREENEEGKFKQLEKDLRNISREYGVAFEKICDDFEAVNCNMEKLHDLLNKQAYTKWTKLHDYILQQDHKDEGLYRQLEQTFSYNEIEERKRFLGLI
jgi:hypothetical protein